MSSSEPSKRARLTMSVMAPVLVAVLVEKRGEDWQVVSVENVSLPTVSGINENLDDETYDAMVELAEKAAK